MLNMTTVAIKNPSKRQELIKASDKTANQVAEMKR